MWRHVSFLLGFLGLLYFSGFSNTYSGNYKFYSLLVPYFTFVLMIYVNMYVLVPWLFFKGRYIFYLAFLIALVLPGLSLNAYLQHVITDLHRIGKPTMNFSRNTYELTVISVCVVLTTTTLKLLQRWAKDNQRLVELSNLTLRMELNELRNQINPHFLFNMLNNVKALIRTDPEKASMVIVKLSEFLRFQLYENNEDRTLLTSEISFLNNFINLEKIRRDNLSVALDTSDKYMLNGIFVPPNLFTTFVENAVKHSLDVNGNKTYIRIIIEINAKTLRFKCQNSVSVVSEGHDKKNSGLGLINIRRRLDLLYQDKYTLTVTPAAKDYTIDLTIPI